MTYSPSTRMTLSTRRTASRPRSASTVADSAASVAWWVTMTSTASSSPCFSWRTVSIETLVLGERGRDPREDAGAVGDVEADVVARHGLAHRTQPQVGVRRLPRAAAAGDLVPRDGDDVAEHRARGRRAARAAAVEHQLAGGLGLDEDRVERLAHRCERVARRDHRRVRADADAAAVVGHLGDGEQLDDAAHRARAGDVGSGDLGDALAVDVGRGDPGVERERREDRGLGGCVEPLDVGGRVGLGVAERLRLLEGVGEAGAALGHPGEDEVGGAVDDAEHPADPVAGQRLAQRPQHRDRAGDRGLVVEVDRRACRPRRTASRRPRRAAPCWR